MDDREIEKLAEIAFKAARAYGDVDGNIKPWDKMPDGMKEGWRRVVKAVLAELPPPQYSRPRAMPF